MLHLFSARVEQLRYARAHYQPRSPQTSTLLYELLLAYEKDPDMSQKLEEFVRQSIDELLAKLPAEKLLEGLSPQERIKGLSADELLQALSPEALEALRQRMKPNGSSAHR